MAKLSILIPAYNEEKTIALILEKVKGIKLRGIVKEIIVVDNASTDKTFDILRKYAGKGIRVIRHKKNMGKGTSIRTALSHATGDIILVQDADLEYDPKDYPRLIKPILEGKARVVYGSRLLGRNVRYARLMYYLGGLSLSKIFKLLYGNDVSDVCCGYKVFSSDVIKGINLKCREFEFDCEVTAKISKKGIKVYNIPISYAPRSRKEGKKINFKDWLKSVYVMLKYRIMD